MKLIVATDEKNGIGLNGDIPWKGVHNDFPFFKSMTYDSTVVMGRKTFESIGSPLLGRENVVVSSTLTRKGDEIVMSAKSLINSLNEVYRVNDWVIGGSGVYDLCMPYVTEMFVTRIPGDWSCDTFFNMPYNFRGAGSFVLNGGLKVERWLR